MESFCVLIVSMFEITQASKLPINRSSPCLSSTLSLQYLRIRFDMKYATAERYKKRIISSPCIPFWLGLMSMSHDKCMDPLGAL